MTDPVFRKVAMADVPADTRRGGALRPLLTPKAVGASSGFMGVASIPPGESISEHYHPHSEEFVYLVSGELICQLDGERHELAAGEGFMTPKNVRHKLINEGEEDAFLVFHMSPLAPRPELGHVDTE